VPIRGPGRETDGLRRHAAHRHPGQGLQMPKIQPRLLWASDLYQRIIQTRCALHRDPPWQTVSPKSVSTDLRRVDGHASLLSANQRRMLRCRWLSSIIARLPSTEAGTRSSSFFQLTPTPFLGRIQWRAGFEPQRGVEKDGTGPCVSRPPSLLSKRVWPSCTRPWKHISPARDFHGCNDTGSRSVLWVFLSPMLSVRPSLNGRVWATTRWPPYPGCFANPRYRGSACCR
jgi:hypothetical protein